VGTAKAIEAEFESGSSGFGAFFAPFIGGYPFT
jgi:hypothetical protein